MVIAVKMYVNRLNISIVGPRAASSSVPVNCSPVHKLSRNFSDFQVTGSQIQLAQVPDQRKQYPPGS